MNVVDSSAWLEYFADTAQADYFAQPIEDVHNLIVPSVCVLEVFKSVLRQRGEDAALHTVAIMQQGTVIDLDTTLALSAAKLGVELKLPLAESHPGGGAPGRVHHCTDIRGGTGHPV